MAPLILNLGTKRRWCDQVHALALLPLGNNPPCQIKRKETWWVAQLVWDVLEKRISYCVRKETILSWLLKTSMLWIQTWKWINIALDHATCYVCKVPSNFNLVSFICWLPLRDYPEHIDLKGYAVSRSASMRYCDTCNSPIQSTHIMSPCLI